MAGKGRQMGQGLALFVRWTTFGKLQLLSLFLQQACGSKKLSKSEQPFCFLMNMRARAREREMRVRNKCNFPSHPKLKNVLVGVVGDEEPMGALLCAQVKRSPDNPGGHVHVQGFARFKIVGVVVVVVGREVGATLPTYVRQMHTKR